MPVVVAVYPPRRPKEEIGGVRIFDLKPNECRFPIANASDDKGDYFYCAAPTAGETSWCPKHRALCHPSTRGAGALAAWAGQPA